MEMSERGIYRKCTFLRGDCQAVASLFRKFRKQVGAIMRRMDFCGGAGGFGSGKIFGIPLR